MVFDREAVFIGSFNLDPRSAVINTEAGLYIESPELAERLIAYMATGVVPANSYRVLLDPNGGIVWETVRDGEIVRYRRRARNRLPPALRRQPGEAPADRLATLTPIAWQPAAVARAWRGIECTAQPTTSTGGGRRSCRWTLCWRGFRWSGTGSESW